MASAGPGRQAVSEAVWCCECEQGSNRLTCTADVQLGRGDRALASGALEPCRLRRARPARGAAEGANRDRRCHAWTPGRACAHKPSDPRPADPLTALAMHHFRYVGGVLHAEDVSLARLAEDVGTPFYCYSTATLERHYRVLQEAFAGLDTLICFAVKANSNQAVITHAGQARRRHGRRVGRRAAPRAGRRRAGRQDHLRRRRQDARGDGLRAGRGHPRLQRRVRAGAARR